jgi:Abnormal spindle-like microcephaly-assoc'd, ASPM-SPD-2-Hydin
VLSTSNSAFQPAYSAATGWDFATGIGTVNAYNLVMAFGTVGPTPTPTPVPVALKFAPKNVQFGKVRVGFTSKPKKITLKNPAKKGGPTIALSGFVFSADFGYFASGTTCLTSITALAPKQKCIIEAGFQPSALGTENGTLTVQDNASNRPQVIQFKGRGK